MNKIRAVLFFFPLLCLLSIATTSCSSPSSDVNEEASDEATPQEYIYGTHEVACCTECVNTCILGSEFSQYLTDPNHPQGSYRVQQYIGDCDCKYVNGVWSLSVNGPVTQNTARWGGPGSGAVCNQGLGALVWSLFQNSCKGSRTPQSNGNGDPFGDWGQWTTKLLDSLMSVGDSLIFGQPVFGIAEFPDHWDLGVNPVSPIGPIRISLNDTQQANQLQEIEIIPDGSRSPLAIIQADGSMQYDLDLNALEPGFYNIKMDFWPGFYLTKTIVKNPS